MTATVRGIKAGGRDGSATSTAKEYTVIYLVGTNDREDGPNTVMNAFGVPKVGDLYAAGNDFNNAAVVTAVNPTEGDSPFEWEVNVTYSTDTGDSDSPQNLQVQIDNPLNEPPEITYGFQTRRVLIPGRYNDPLGPPGSKAWEQGIFLPNGELFDPQPEMEIDEPILTINRNFQTINGAALMALANCVNSDFFQGAEPRQLKLSIPQAQKRWHKAINHYWNVTYSMAFRWETWDVQLLNQGSYYFSGGKPTSVWSTTVRRLVKRDDDGKPLIVNLTTNGDINTTATPTFTRLRVRREIQFNSLGLL